MSWYFIVKAIHILSAMILFGTGIGIAFFMWCSRFSSSLGARQFAATWTVRADLIFTLPAVIAQPLSGYGLMVMAGFNFDLLWIQWSLILYLLAGLCWLPVLWIQVQLRDLVNNYPLDELPKEYNRYFNLWFVLGWPAFLALIGILYLMIAKPI